MVGGYVVDIYLDHLCPPKYTRFGGGPILVLGIHIECRDLACEGRKKIKTINGSLAEY